MSAPTRPPGARGIAPLLLLASVVGCANGARSDARDPGPEAVRDADEVVDLGEAFGDAEATFVLLDLGTGRTIRHDPDRAARRFLPASTFKIPNNLIALETGVVEGPGFAMAWDSVQVPRGRFFPDAWARDQTLESAFRNSVYWFYQALARRIGEDRYREWLARLDYGNRDVGGGIDRFWLEGDLRISADEQVGFLRRLWNGDLCVSDRSARIVKDLMLLESTPAYRLLGKTGTAELTPTRELGWIVGFVETPEGPRAYALNMEGERVWEDWPPQERKALVVAILEELGIVEADDDPDPEEGR